MTKKIVLKLICLCLILCTAVAAVPFASASDGNIEIVKVKEDIKRGERISANNVELVSVKNVNLPDNVITDINQAYGNYAQKDLYAGNYLSNTQIGKSNTFEARADVLKRAITKSEENFVVVTDYIKPNTGENVVSHLQNIINRNPGRTIYFPDGEYVISSSLITKPEQGQTTTFFFSPNAVLKADDNWKSVNGKTALICLGGTYVEGQGEQYNDNMSIGSYYGVFGGVFDGNNKADGISIDCSRESVIYGCLIKNAVTGIEIKDGANGVSSDADIENVTIVGGGNIGTTGIKLIGYDNTVSNVKIYDMEVGVHLCSGGNALRSIEVFFTNNPDHKLVYSRTIGIKIELWLSACSFFYDCLVEDVAIAYYVRGNATLVMDGLRGRWTYDIGNQVMFQFVNEFNVKLTQCRAEFYGDKNPCVYISSNGNGAIALIDSPILSTANEISGDYKKYLTDSGVLEISKP